MLITKKWTYEMSHRVKDAFTNRCSENIHGHSYDLEVRIKASMPDKADMVMDFGLLKKYMHPFVDSFDHAHMLYAAKDVLSKSDQKYISDANQRYIVAPFTSTAEMQAKMFFTFARAMLHQLQVEGVVNYSVQTDSCTVHETRTGSATFTEEDFKTCNFPIVSLREIQFSQGILNEWTITFYNFYKTLIQGEIKVAK